MFKNKKMNVVEEVHTVLGAGSKFEGKLYFEGVVRIDGVFIGEIYTRGELIIGESAKVNGEMEVENVDISGEVEGRITASNKVHIRGTAKVKGEVYTRVLIVDEGAVFNGTTSMEVETETPVSVAE